MTAFGDGEEFGLETQVAGLLSLRALLLDAAESCAEGTTTTEQLAQGVRFAFAAAWR